MLGFELESVIAGVETKGPAHTRFIVCPVHGTKISVAVTHDKHLADRGVDSIREQLEELSHVFPRFGLRGAWVAHRCCAAYARQGLQDSARLRRLSGLDRIPSINAAPRSRPASEAGKASGSRNARNAMYCAVHSPMPGIERNRVIASSMVPNGRKRFRSATAAFARAFNDARRADGMPSPMDSALAKHSGVGNTCDNPG